MAIKSSSNNPDKLIKNDIDIRNFLQGAVYCWSKNIEKRFAFRDLMGGVNTIWESTPLQSLHDYYFELNKEQLGKNELTDDELSKAKEKAYAEAAKYAGKLLKQVIRADKRNYIESVDDGRAHYEWDRKGK